MPPAPDYTSSTPDQSTDYAKSPYAALINAGLGMMAASGQRDAHGLPLSPFAAIGKGGMEGMKTLEEQRSAAQKDKQIELQAKHLADEAAKWRTINPYQAAELQLRQQTLAQSMAMEKMKLAQQERQLEQQGWHQSYNLSTGQPIWTNPRTQEGYTIQNGQMVPLSRGPATPMQNQPGGPQFQPTSGGQQPQATPIPYQPAGEQRSPLDFRYTPPVKENLGSIFTPQGRMQPDVGAASKQLIERAQTGGLAAQSMEARLNQLENDYKTLDQPAANWAEGQMTNPGTALAQSKIWLAKHINSVLPGTIDPKRVGAAEDITKQVVYLGQEKARELGAREAAQVIQQTIQANPGLETTPEGRKRIVAGLRMAIERQKDFSQFVKDYRQTNGTAAGADAAFEKQNPASRYYAQAEVNALPPARQKTLNRDVQDLYIHRNDPEAVKRFDKEYNNLSQYFLGVQQ